MKSTEEMYYNRIVGQRIVDKINKDYQWLIKYVENNPELDFQTGSNKQSTWFSVYRGTGRIFTISTGFTARSSIKVWAADAYLDLQPSFYDNPSEKGFEELLIKIRNNPYFDRYYADNGNKNKREGYYQNLISMKRYSLFCQSEDEFVIVDKEFVLGYSDQTTKDNLCKPIDDEYKKIIDDLNNGNEVPHKGLKSSGSECDFVGLCKNGDIILLELKRKEDNEKIMLSPLQVSKYGKYLQLYMGKNSERLERDIIDMTKQKINDLHILKPKWNIPEHLTGNVRLAVVVGGEVDKRTKSLCDKVEKKINDVNVEKYKCDEYGTLIKGW